MPYAYVNGAAQAWLVGVAPAALPLAIAAGNRVVALVASPAADVVTGIADTAGNTYTQLVSFTDVSGIHCAVYEALNVAAATSLTPAFSGTSGTRTLYVVQYSGTHLTAPSEVLAKISYNPGVTTLDGTRSQPGSPSLVPSLVVGVYLNGYTVAAVAGTGFTSRGALRDYVFEDMRKLDALPVAATWTRSATTGRCDAFGLMIPELGAAPFVQVSQQGYKDLLLRGGFLSKRVAAGTPVVLGVPTIIGTPVEGVAVSFARAATLSAQTRTQQWLLDNVDIAGATGVTYTPSASDVAHLLTVRQIETNAAGAASATSLNNVICAAVSGYGATADAGEVNVADVVAGSKFYVDSAAGLDTNSGLTSALAWQTLTPVAAKMVAATAPDSEFLLARSGTYLGALSGPSYTFGAQGAGARPIVKYARQSVMSNRGVVFWNEAPSLTGQPFTVANLQIDGDLSTEASFTVGAGTFVAGDTITGNTSGATATVLGISAGRLVYRPVSGSFTASEAFHNVGSTATGTWSSVALAIGGVAGLPTSRFLLKNLDIRNCNSNGITISIGGVLGYTVQNVTITNCTKTQGNGAGMGGGGVHTKVLNVSVSQCGSVGITNHQIYMDDFSSSIMQGLLIDGSSGTGNHALVIHGINSDVTIMGNDFNACNNGIGINSGYTTPESFVRFKIAKNKIRNMGTVAGQTQGNAMLLQGLVDSSVENNVCFNNANSGVVLYEGSGAFFAGDTVCTRVAVRYNLFGGTTTPYYSGGNILGVVAPSAMTGLVFENNIFYTPATAAVALFEIPVGIPDKEVVFRNCCFWAPNNTNGDAVIKYQGTNYTVAAFQALKPGMMQGCIYADPQFKNEALQDYRLSIGSPCYHAGVPVLTIPDDFLGVTRHATTPSIGPYEVAA